MLGTDAADTPRMMSLEMMLRPTANGTVQFRFANSVAAAGRTSTTRAGSILHATKLGYEAVPPVRLVMSDRDRAHS